LHLSDVNDQPFMGANIAVGTSGREASGSAREQSQAVG
jgi:hypothetical protein